MHCNVIGHEIRVTANTRNFRVWMRVEVDGLALQLKVWQYCNPFVSNNQRDQGGETTRGEVEVWSPSTGWNSLMTFNRDTCGLEPQADGNDSYCTEQYEWDPTLYTPEVIRMVTKALELLDGPFSNEDLARQITEGIAKLKPEAPPKGGDA